ncbi:MAG: hypothetical protein KOO62_04815 [candidate division Zixibacteria bacterium]|nr:hypothetical protein [candidate division Zixibacteria bacterium]
MNKNRYTLAGWLSMSMAAILPLSIVLGIIESIIGKKVLGWDGPIFGFSDVLSLIFVALAVYTIYMFRKLLKERYEFHAANTILIVAIIWQALFAIVGFTLELSLFLLWPVAEIPALIVMLLFFITAMTTGGVIDILLASKLLQLKDKMSDLMKAFAWVTMISGVLQVTVILSPFALILVPVWCVMLGMIFLREKEEVEYL